MTDNMTESAAVDLKGIFNNSHIVEIQTQCCKHDAHVFSPLFSNSSELNKANNSVLYVS